MSRSRALLLLGALLPIAPLGAVSEPDPPLLRAIEAIQAIDNHSHALPARTPEKGESEAGDPLGETAFAYPPRLRLSNDEYREAWSALYGYRHGDMTAAHAREALAAKLGLMASKGDAYPAWVLDQAGIEVMLVNLPALGVGQVSPRFLWVPPADGLLVPFAGGEPALQALRQESGLEPSPGTLDQYVDAVVHAKLRQWRTAGAVAIKFAIAYLRPLDFADVPADVASAIYARRVAGGSPSAADTKALQDYLFRAVVAEAGRVGLVVHIHTGIGADPYFHLGGANPLLLESALNDPALRHTKVVMIHGGWPFDREAGAMLLKPNVYIDFSAQVFLRSTPALSETLQEWLEFSPEKVLFGTDAYSENTPLANWEEKAWLTTRTARRALALALTRMLASGQITRPRAEEMAHLVLRDNAARLYGLAATARPLAPTNLSENAMSKSDHEAAKASGSIQYLNSGKVLPASLPFSEAVRVGDTLYLSGQLGITPGKLELVPGGIKEEARQTMDNIKTALEAHGYGMQDLVKCTVMLADMAEWGAFNEVYKTYFTGRYPARSAFGANGLALGARVEVECIAAVSR